MKRKCGYVEFMVRVFLTTFGIRSSRRLAKCTDLKKIWFYLLLCSACQLKMGNPFPSPRALDFRCMYVLFAKNYPASVLALPYFQEIQKKVIGYCRGP